MKPNNIYLVWAQFQRRAVSFADAFDFSVSHMPTESKSKLGKIGKYLSCMFQSWALIYKTKPAQIWLQLPPNFLVHITLLYRWVSRADFKVVADCHNASLRAPWSVIPLAITAMNKCDLVIVHNADVYKDAVALGIREDRLIVLEDAPAYVLSEPPAKVGCGGHVLVPCSFHDDEPIAELLEAAKQCPEHTFKITGPKHKAEAKGFVQQAPDNVIFTGFVSVDDYDELVWGAAVVIGLTTMDGIQLSVAGEALGAGRPLLLSDTQTLRTLFEDGAEFIANTAEGIAEGVQKSALNNEQMAADSQACGEARLEAWQAQANAVKHRIA